MRTIRITRTITHEGKEDIVLENLGRSLSNGIHKYRPDYRIIIKTINKEVLAGETFKEGEGI